MLIQQTTFHSWQVFLRVSVYLFLFCLTWYRNEYLIFQKIIKLEYEFPEKFFPKAKDLVRQLLVGHWLYVLELVIYFASFQLYENTSHLRHVFPHSHWNLPKGLGVKKWAGMTHWSNILSSTPSPGVTYTYRHHPSSPHTSPPCLKMMKTVMEM